MTFHPEILCPFCGLGCGDIGIDLDDSGIAPRPSGCPQADRLFRRSLSVATDARLAGTPVPADRAVAEAARLLVNGGRLWLLVLNPLAPYRWRWRGSGISASEPLAWRRRLREAGLSPDPVSQGLGPSWSVQVSPLPQQGPGLRAAYLLRAEKRAIPMTAVRTRRVLPIVRGLPAA